MSGYCPFCGAQLPAPPDGEARATVACPVCAQEIDAPGPAEATGPASPAGPDTLAGRLGRPAPEPPPAGPAWEGEGGLPSRLWHTTWQVMLHPVRTLTPPGPSGLKWPLSYGLILGTLATASQLFWSRRLGMTEASSTFTMVMLILSPLQVLVSLYLTAAIIHAALFILGGAKRGYAATFRALAYTQAAGLWMLVPILGLALALVWGVVISAGGLAAVHGIGKGRALAALLLPLFLGLLLLLLVGLVVGIGVLAAMLGAGQGAGIFRL